MTSAGPLVVVGDTLLDRDLVGQAERLCPDAPVPVVENVVERSRPGGAGLAAVLAADDGHSVVLITGLSNDARGRALQSLLERSGVDVIDLGLDGPTTEKVRVSAAGHPLVRLDFGPRVPNRIGELVDDRALQSASAVLVSDYGRGVTASATVRQALGRLPGRVQLVWDPHRLGAAPVPGTRLATPNAQEVGVDECASWSEVTHAARRRQDQWSVAALAVTMGARGALLTEGHDPPLIVPAPLIRGGDPCGAGDRFASAAAGLLAQGALPSEAVAAAVEAASAFVAAGGAASAGASLEGRSQPPWADGFEAAAAVRAQGGTVVAAGGCFDILHAGHLSLLASARAIGDCLVVCLNSDGSVRRLKGPGRPVQRVEDRAALLLGLACVDGVVVFDEDTPLKILSELRPDVFAKGADYSVETLPETALMASWGGQAVVLPYLPGRSTTQLVQALSGDAPNLDPSRGRLS